VRLEWALLAIADRESIFDYIAPENLDAALALDELFERKAALLGAHPEAGRVDAVVVGEQYPHQFLLVRSIRFVPPI